MITNRDYFDGRDNICHLLAITNPRHVLACMCVAFAFVMHTYDCATFFQHFSAAIIQSYRDNSIAFDVDTNSVYKTATRVKISTSMLNFKFNH
jgi:hypothetical protein